MTAPVRAGLISRSLFQPRWRAGAGRTVAADSFAARAEANDLVGFVAPTVEQLALVTNDGSHRLAGLRVERIYPGAPETVPGHYFDRARSRPAVHLHLDKKLNCLRGRESHPPKEVYFRRVRIGHWSGRILKLPSIIIKRSWHAGGARLCPVRNGNSGSTPAQPRRLEILDRFSVRPCCGWSPTQPRSRAVARCAPLAEFPRNKSGQKRASILCC